MQKVVLKLDVHDDNKCRKRVMKIASSVPGVDQISLDMKERKLTLVGNVDAVEAVKKLRKVYHTEVLTIGPAKVPEKPKDKPNDQVIEYVNVYKPQPCALCHPYYCYCYHYHYQ